MVRNSVTLEVVTRMVELYEAGMTIREVGTEVGFNRETVTRHLRKAGAKLRRQGLDAANVERAQELYLGGQTLAQVGEVLGVAPGTVGKYLRDHGVLLRPPLFPS